MYVVLALAGVAILGAVVVVAMGRGGELSQTHPDVPPLSLPEDRPVAGTDVAQLRLPRGIWGYQVEPTDEALRRLAHALTERDARVAALEQQLAELRQQYGEEPPQDAWRPSPAKDDDWNEEAAETPWEDAASEELGEEGVR